jgi:DNA-binding NtrC family response regulator
MLATLDTTMKTTILAVDDDPLDLAPLRLILESWGHEVLTANSGNEALGILRGQPVDLVVSDVRMPRMSGEDLLTRVLADFPGLPVVLFTGRGDIKSAVNAMKLGAFDYVTKPPDEEEFRITVDRALESGRLRRENAFLRAELGAAGRYGERLLGRSPAMLAVFDTINRVARTDSTVMITGETGTGKELVAQAIHYRSQRCGAPLVAFNCAALNPNLIESELFGHEKGAFTGAVAARRGRFEEADGGTLFLDEIGEMDIGLQAKLLRVLQERSFERVGGSTQVAVDARLIASTHRDLAALVKEGRFREDLYYRLRVIPIHIPPLRERREDILPLAEHFAVEYAERYGSNARAFSSAAKEFLLSQPWKGNVRELQHAVERAVVLGRGEAIEPGDIAIPDAGPTVSDTSDATLQSALDRASREHIVRALDRCQWRKQQAAALLGIDRVTLYRLLKKFSLG